MPDPESNPGLKIRWFYTVISDNFSPTGWGMAIGEKDVVLRDNGRPIVGITMAQWTRNPAESQKQKPSH